MRNMALGNAEIEAIESNLARWKSGYESTKDLGVKALHDCYHNSAFSAWTTGTEFGSNFLSNLESMRSVSNNLKTQCDSLHERVQSFLERQKEINQNGK